MGCARLVWDREEGEEKHRSWGGNVGAIKTLELSLAEHVRQQQEELQNRIRTLELSLAEHVRQQQEEPQHRPLSPSPSHSSFGTTISSCWIDPVPDAKSEGSWELVPSQIDYNDEAVNPGMVASAPGFTPPARCLLKDSFLLDEKGKPVSVMKLHRGARLCSLRSDENGNLTPGVAIVRATRISMLRDTDIASIKLQHQDSQEQDSDKHLEMRVTTSHSILVTTAASELKDWIACPAGELQAGRHKLFLLQSESGTCYDFLAINTFVQTCEVVEIELEDNADAIMLQLRDGSFVGVFGSPPWPTMQIITKNASIDVQTISDSKSSMARSSNSDPTHDRRAKYPVYRQINRPHDAHCLARCKFYFTAQGCKKGKLCTLCHDPEHQAKRAHRGVHKRR